MRHNITLDEEEYELYQEMKDEQTRKKEKESVKTLIIFATGFISGIITWLMLGGVAC